MARATHVHKPLINFIGKRVWGASILTSLKSFAYNVGAVESHGVQPHPQAPNSMLPTPVTDFKRYRVNAQQHGPLARAGHYPSRSGQTDNSSSSDVVLDRNDLPARFRRMVPSAEEIEAIAVSSRS